MSSPLIISPSNNDFFGIQSQLSDTACELFDRFAELHSNKPYGAISEFHHSRQKTSEGTFHILRWEGAGSRSGTELPVDVFDFAPFLALKFLANIGNNDNQVYVLTDLGLQFYKWRIKQAGSEPIEQVEHTIRSIINDPEKFGSRHPKAAQHLRSAFDKILSQELNDGVILDIGSSLRTTLMENTADLTRHESNPEAIKTPEQVAKALAPWLKELEEKNELAPRHAELIKSMIAATASSSNRLFHVRDEKSAGKPSPSWNEIRRTAFAVVLCCYELDALS